MIDDFDLDENGGIGIFYDKIDLAATDGEVICNECVSFAHIVVRNKLFACVSFCVSIHFVFV